MESVNGLLGPKFTDFKHTVREFTKEFDKTLKVTINYCHEKMVGDRVELLQSAVKIIKIAVPFVFFFQRPIVFLVSAGVAFAFTYQKHSGEIIQQIKELWDRAGYNFHATALLLTIAAHQVVPLAIFGIVSTSFVGVLSGVQARDIFDYLREYFKHEPQVPQDPQQPQAPQVPPGRENQRLVNLFGQEVWVPNLLPQIGQHQPQAPQQPQAAQPQPPAQRQPQAPQQPVQQNQANQPQVQPQQGQQNQINQPQVSTPKAQLAIDTTVAIVSNTMYYGGQAIKGAGTVARFGKTHYPQVIAVGKSCYNGAKTCLSKARSMGSSLLSSETQTRRRSTPASTTHRTP